MDEGMKANELMIGDWVWYNNQPHQIRQVGIFGENRDGDDYPAVCVGKPNGVGLILERNEIEPIPLTLEILEKNGFVANKHIYPYPYYEYINKEDKLKVGFAFPQGNRTSYKDPWVYIDSERVFVEHLPCMFVHQLQHALRICGITLNIEV